MEDQAKDETADNELIWKAHVLDAQKFEGTHAEYCELHGLKLRQFRRYKQKFGSTRTYRPRKARAFFKVESEAMPQAEPMKRSRALPDPRWVAELILALVGER